MDGSLLLLILIPIGGYMITRRLWGEKKSEKKDNNQKKDEHKEKEGSAAKAETHVTHAVHDDHDAPTAQSVLTKVIKNRKRNYGAGPGILIIFLTIAAWLMSMNPTTQWVSDVLWLIVVFLTLRLIVGFLFNWGWWLSGLTWVVIISAAIIFLGWPAGLAYHHDPFNGRYVMTKDRVQQKVDYVFKAPGESTSSTKTKITFAKEVVKAKPVTMTMSCDTTVYNPLPEDGVEYRIPSELNNVKITAHFSDGRKTFGVGCEDKLVGKSSVHGKPWLLEKDMKLADPCTGQTKEYILIPIDQDD